MRVAAPIRSRERGKETLGPERHQRLVRPTVVAAPRLSKGVTEKLDAIRVAGHRLVVALVLAPQLIGVQGRGIVMVEQVIAEVQSQGLAAAQIILTGKRTVVMPRS